MKKMLHEASSLNDPTLMLALYMRSAWQNLDQKNFTSTFLDYLRSYELLQTIRLQDHLGKNYQLYTIALLFYQFNDFRKAIEISEKVEQPFNILLHQVWVSNLQGMCYLRLENYDSARYYFAKALEPKLSPAELQLTWNGIIDGNIGNTWFLQKEYDKAIPFLLSGIEKTLAGKEFENAAGFENSLATIYLAKNQPAQAFNILKDARIHTYTAKNNNNFSKLYSGLSSYYRYLQQPALTLQYQDSMLYYQKILDREMDDKIKVQAEYNFQNEKQIDERERLEAETKHQKSIRNLIIGILFLLMVVALLFFSRAAMRHTFKTKQLDAEKRKAEAELASAQIQLDDFTRSLKEKNNLIEQFSDELEKIQVNANQAMSSDQYEVLDQLRQSAILTDEHWEIFRSRFEKVHGGYLQRLRSKLPDLNPAEIRFMALAKLQLTNKEMSGILGVSPDSVRMMRHRLRRKLNLVEEGSLDELIGSI